MESLRFAQEKDVAGARERKVLAGTVVEPTGAVLLLIASVDDWWRQKKPRRLQSSALVMRNTINVLGVHMGDFIAISSRVLTHIFFTDTHGESSTECDILHLNHLLEQRGHVRRLGFGDAPAD